VDAGRVPLRQLFSLEGMVALVTGANSGIGGAIAAAYAEAGAAVILVARRETELQVAEDTIKAAGGRAAHIACDLAVREDLFACVRPRAAVLRRSRHRRQRGRHQRRKPMAEITEADWDATMRVNLDASFFLPQRLAPAMIAKGWGRIVNIASLQSVRAFGNSGPYGASKGGIAQLTRAQAEAWSRHGVNANAIAPGFFATPLTAAVANDPERWKSMAAKTFVGRNGELDDLRGAAVFLRAARQITSRDRRCSSTAAFRRDDRDARMKALVYTRPNEVTYRDEPIRVLRRVSGARHRRCRDLRIGHARLPRPRSAQEPPLILGHELCGTVVAGAGAGKRVTVNPLITCGRCDYCLGGRNNLCSDRTMIGMTRPGWLRRANVHSCIQSDRDPAGYELPAGRAHRAGGHALHAIDPRDACALTAAP
jgi:gluconate 5-dehydrogenase